MIASAIELSRVAPIRRRRRISLSISLASTLLVWLSAGCHSPTKAHPEIPRSLAERHLRAVTPGYALYATNASDVSSLQEWVDAELSLLESETGVASPPRGLIVTIDSTKEPLPEIEKLRIEVVARPASTTDLGRYCITESSYFTESFYVAPAELARVLGDDRVANFAWACLLTTDAYMLRSYDAMILSKWSLWGAHTTTDPTIWPAMLLSLPAMPFMLGGYAYLSIHYRGMDRDFMHLQRRATLWSAVLTAEADPEASPRQSVIEVVENIRREWQTTWRARPQD